MNQPFQSFSKSVNWNLTLHHNYWPVSASHSTHISSNFFIGFCTFSTVDGQCCLSHGGGDGGAALVSAPTQFPENPKHTSSTTTAMAKMLGTIICGPEWFTKKEKNIFYRTIWYSITRTEHIKSQYLQIVMILAMLWGIPSPSKPEMFSYQGTCVASTYRHTVRQCAGGGK